MGEYEEFALGNLVDKSKPTWFRFNSQSCLRRGSATEYIRSKWFCSAVATYRRE